MSLFDLIHGKLASERRRGYERLFCEDINVFLKNIYAKLGRRMKWKLIQLRPHQVELKDLSSGETKQWVVHLMPPENIKNGDVGKVFATSNKISWDVLRNQRALFIAAELYVYHAFALDKNHKMLERIRLQNHYLDMWKRFTGKETAEHIRDKALQYIVHGIGEEKLAFYSPKGFFTSLKRLESHDKDIAKALGATETAFKDIFFKRRTRYSARMLQKEETIISTELAHIDHLLDLLSFDRRDRTKLSQHTKTLDRHISNLKVFKSTLSKVLKDIKKWEHKDKGSHRDLKQSRMRFEHLNRTLKIELSRHRIDINKVYIVMGHFQKEKINILRDLDVLNRRLEKRLSPKSTA